MRDETWRERFKRGYFYPTPMMWGQWGVMSSLAVMAGMKAAHIGLCRYLLSFDDDEQVFFDTPRVLPYEGSEHAG